MDYALAKKLNDSGYKFKSLLDVDSEKTFFMLDDGKGYRAPLLGELIDACGEGLQELSRATYSAWGTNPKHTDCDSFSFQTEGDTPLEAVARLWLALNKK